MTQTSCTAVSAFIFLPDIVVAGSSAAAGIVIIDYNIPVALIVYILIFPTAYIYAQSSKIPWIW